VAERAAHLSLALAGATWVARFLAIERCPAPFSAVARAESRPRNETARSGAERADRSGMVRRLGIEPRT
jgi:hypothetical protein